LPASWEEFLALVSKGHRKQLRRAEREFFQSGRAELTVVENCQQLDATMDVLIDLHHKRRQALGEAGCFASSQYTAFHREVSRRLLMLGHLQLLLLKLDGRIVAADYHITSQGVTYAYQGGIDPEQMHVEPGKLITMAAVRRAIEQGGRAIDFLRGDEPYKAHFRAVARPSLALRVVPNRTGSRLRNSLWLAGRGVKRWLNQTAPLSALQAVAAADQLHAPRARSQLSLQSLNTAPSS
jgi:CelD/BcsL family acetyltransferase involved in cellulose biosynthesis